MARAVDGLQVQPSPRLTLIGEFQLVIADRAVAVPHGVQKLLAFLAIAGDPMSRSTIAGQLWLDVPEWRALGNLRTALWRLGRIPSRVVRALDGRLMLDPDLQVDFTELTDVASRMLDAPESISSEQFRRLLRANDILPAWEDEWLVVERERFRELRIYALETACDAMTASGNLGRAVQACAAAIEVEPFRESAQRLLVRAHLAEGNRAAALRSYLAYRDLIEAELGITPSDLMEDLVTGLVNHGPARGG